MNLVERCWIWTRCDSASGDVQRGVMFHEPEASREWLSVDEYVPAEQLRGAVSREKIDAALDTVAYLHDISGGALDYLRATLLDPTGGQ